MADFLTQRPHRKILAAGALLGALGVMLGAFGAHGLEDRLTSEQAGWWGSAVQYQMWHALALVAAGLLPAGRRQSWLLLSFGGGTLIFSGTLYAMALGGPRWLGAVTPVGGLLLILGWLLLALAATDRRAPPGDEP